MTNTSATGGPLQPAGSPTPPPLTSAAWLDFLQQWVVNLSTIDGTLVRPRWQAEPINIPDAGSAWCAFGITDWKVDTYPATRHVGDNDGRDVLHRHETFTLTLSFYDTGVSGLADQFCMLFRDNSAIPQNWEYLIAADTFFISVGEMVPLPTLTQTRWLYRVDLEVTLRREIIRDYPVLNVLEGVVSLDIDQPPGIGNQFPIDIKATEWQATTVLSGASALSATPS